MSRRIPLVVAALVLAVLGGLLLVNSAGDRGAEAAPAEEPAQAPVLVAKQLIAAGTTGQELADGGLVELKDMPIVAVPDGALVDVVLVRDMVVTADVQAGQMLLQADFRTRSDAGAVEIPDDKVAISVAVDPGFRVGNFVQPGSEVAVFTTYAVDQPQPKPLPPATSEWPAGSAPPKVGDATRLMLPRALILAVGDTTVEGLAAAPVEDGSEQSTVVVTLAVTIEEAQKLAHAAQVDKVTLALLSDASRTGTGSADDNRTLFN